MEQTRHSWPKYVHMVRQRLFDSSPLQAVLSVGSDADARYWQSTFGQGVVTGGTAAEIEASVEDPPLGSFLGTLKLAQDFPGSLSGDRSVVLSVFGEGRRMSPITQALNGIKPALRLLRLHPEARRAVSVAELALFFSSPLSQWLNESGFDGFLLKWGDEVQVPGVDLPPLDLSGTDVVRFVSSRFDLERNAADKDWVVARPDDRQVLAMVARQPAASLEATLGGPGLSGGRPYLNAGTFALARPLLRALDSEFGSDLDGSVRLDWDPVVFAALVAGSDEVWDASCRLADGEQNPAVSKVLRAVPDLRRRMQAVRQRFESEVGRPVSAAAVDLGEILWLDCGLHSSLYEMFDWMLSDGLRGETVRQLFGVEGGLDEQGNRLVNSYVAPGARVTRSLIVDSVISSSDSVLDRACVIGSGLSRCSLPEGGVVAYSEVDDYVARGPRTLGYLAKAASLELEEGARVSSVNGPEGSVLLRGTESLAETYGPTWYEGRLGSNEVSFAEARALAMEAGRDPFS